MRPRYMIPVALTVAAICSFELSAIAKDTAATAAPATGQAQTATFENAKKIVKGEAPAATAEQKKQAADTAKAVNDVPGVKVSAQELTPPKLPPIKGFHPIKRALRPIEEMQLMVVKLQQQIMRLEGPIAGLNPPMVKLQGNMKVVDQRMANMEKQLNAMQSQVVGVRSDIGGMREQIAKLEKPITKLEKPIASVAEPLEEVRAQLNWIIAAIVFAAILIAVGTPVAGFLIYVNRHKLFPAVPERDMPKVDTSQTPARGSARR